MLEWGCEFFTVFEVSIHVTEQPCGLCMILYDPAPEYSSAPGYYVWRSESSRFEVAQPPRGEAKVVRVVNREKYEEFIDYIPFMNVRLQAASLKTFQSP